MFDKLAQARKWALTDAAAVGVLVGVEAGLCAGALVVKNNRIHAGGDER